MIIFVMYHHFSILKYCSVSSVKHCMAKANIGIPPAMLCMHETNEVNSFS